MEAGKYGWRSIRLRLFALFALVIACVLYYAIADLARQWQARSTLSASVRLSEFSVHLSGLIHELQKERGLSTGFVGSGGSNFRVELDAQRSESDRHRAALQSWVAESAALPPAVVAALDTAGRSLAALAGKRSEVGSLSLSSGAAFGYYSDTIGDLLAVLERSAAAAEAAELVRDMTTYLMFVSAKEQAGRERAALNGLFAANQRASLELHRRVIAIITAQDVHLDGFRARAPEQWADALDGVLRSAVGVEAERLRQQALERMEFGYFAVEPAHWFETITSKINGMKEVEDLIAGDITRQTAALLKAANWQLALAVALCVLAAALALVFGLLVSTVLTGLHRVALAAQGVAAGRLADEIPVHDDNELGEIEQALAAVRNNVQAMIDDAGMLSQAAIDGRLATRADAGRHQGDFRRIVEGVNGTLD
ncbi:MAG: nitrate- and nitrite sensing domain-containing protein, partial [Thauera sp.]|nr:nitrate- and nitrite sensing domain-containing protein [Thauera sp.]